MDDRTSAVRKLYMDRAEDLLVAIENAPVIPSMPTPDERENQIRLMAVALLNEYMMGYRGER